MNIVHIFLMPDDISFIVESLLTYVTFIRLDFVMNHSNMNLQVEFQPESLFTLFTLKESGFVMPFLMETEKTSFSKSFVTLVTFVLLFAYSMYHHKMGFIAFFTPENLGTDVTYDCVKDLLMYSPLVFL